MKRHRDKSRKAESVLDDCRSRKLGAGREEAGSDSIFFPKHVNSDGKSEQFESAVRENHQMSRSTYVGRVDHETRFDARCDPVWTCTTCFKRRGVRSDDADHQAPVSKQSVPVRPVAQAAAQDNPFAVLNEFGLYNNKPHKPANAASKCVR
jgi:hypothetical protein